MVICLKRDVNDLLMVHCHPIISCSSKIQNGLPFWCRLTQVVLEKRPLNGRGSSSSSVGLHTHFGLRRGKTRYQRHVENVDDVQAQLLLKI